MGTTEALEAQVTGLGETLADAHTELRTTASALAAREDELAAARDESERLQAQLDERMSASELTAAELEHLRAELADREQSVGEMRTDLDAQDAAAEAAALEIVSLREAAETTAAELARREADAQAARAELDRLETLVAERAMEAETSAAEAARLRDEVVDQAGAIEAFQDVIAQQRQQLRDGATAFEAAEAEAQRALDDQAATEALVGRLGAEMDRLEADSTELANLRVEFAEAAQGLSTALADNEELTTRLTASEVRRGRYCRATHGDAGRGGSACAGGRRIGPSGRRSSAVP